MKIHMDMGIQPSMGSLATNIQSWANRSATKLQPWIASLAKKAKKPMVLALSANWIHHTIPPVAVLAGAAALGFWCGSISAALFAGAVLFFLAGIYKALRQIVATLGSGRSGGSERNFEISARAIEHLRPWIEDETSLTEESAKACCAVLLDTLATLHPQSIR